ncbi:MAG: amidohydrolase [Acidimicrobiia bacterium]|nr:amidohydrolase [Acidimicrobiia bacterium]
MVPTAVRNAPVALLDCDTHCYETRDAFTRFLPKAYLDRAISPMVNAAGQEVVMAAGRVATLNSEQSIGFDFAYRPGSLKEMLRQMASGDPNETYQPEPMQPEYLERAAREALMDVHGVERCVLFPAAMALGAEHYVADTDALYVNLMSFNRWYDETWGFAGPKIYATPLLSFRDLNRALELTDFILERGAKVVFIPAGPAAGRSPADPHFDPVWARLNEAGVTVAIHIQATHLFTSLSPLWGQNPDPSAWQMSAWQWMNVMGERAAINTLSALIFDNLFGRFPNLRLLVAEHGASWLPHTLDHMDKSRGMGRNGPWIGGRLSERPSTIFQRHCLVTPFPEDDVPAIVDQLGGDSSCIVMGSDFPHAEGVAEPAEFAKLLHGLSDQAQYGILRGNAEPIFA